MKKFKKLGTKSVLWTWTVSYIIVLFIPLITVFVNYSINVTTIRQEIVKANELTLNNIGDNIDHFLESAEGYYWFSFGDEYFVKVQESDTRDAFFYGKAKEYLEAVRLYANCSSMDMYYMYYRNDLNYVITNATADDAERYHKRLLHYWPDFVSYEDWKSFLEQEYSKDYFVGPNMIHNPQEALYGDKKEYLLYFANTIYNAPYGNPNILVGIPLREIAGLTAYFDSQIYFTLDIDDTPIVAFRNGEVMEVPADAESKEVLRIHRNSNRRGVSYSMVIPEEYLRKELQSTRNSFMLNVMLTLVFGVSGTVLLLRRNYMPLHELVMEVKGDTVFGNEFQEMSLEYKKLKKENLDYQEVAASQRKELISSWLLSMMKGRTTRLQTKETEAFFHLDIDGDVALVGFMIPMYDKRNIQYDELLFFIVDNIFTELMSDYKFYRVEDGRFLLYLFDLRESTEEDWLKFVTEQADFLCNMVEEKWGASLIGAVSDAEKDLDNIRFLYQKVVGAFEYQSIAGNVGIIQTRMLESRNEEERLAEYAKNELSEGLRKGNMKCVRTVVEQLFAVQERIPFMAMKMYIFDIFPVAAQIYRDYEPDSNKHTEIVRYMERLTQSAGMEDLKQTFLAMLEFVCNGVANRQTHETSSVVGKIREYVSTHYQDQNLNISTLAEYMQRNPKYISKIFKDETGEGILDYINRLRITSARELLMTGKYTVEEVMQITGYVNISSFRRNFLKVTGETPGKYTKQV